MKIVAFILALFSSCALAQNQVNVAVYESPPFIYTDDNGDYQGFDIKVIEAVAEKAGFSINYIEVDQFPKLLEVVESGKADAAISSITITPQREKSVDFSQPYMHTGLGILVSDNQSLSMTESIGSWAQVRIPLFIDLMTICFFFVIALCVFGFLLYITDEQRKKDGSDEDGLTLMEVFRGSANSVWLAFTTGSTIGYGDVYPKRVAARIVAVLCFFSVAILVSSLTASITSFNVVQQIQTGIQSAKDLEDRTVATVSGTTSVKAARQYGAVVKEFDNIDQAIAAMILGNVEAVVYDEPNLRYFAQNQGLNKVRLVNTVFESQDYGIAFNEGTEVLEQVNVSLLELQQNGTIAALESEYIGSK